ncbi:hypothetical protein FIBSPDRAFT_926046 [Athelia psychrophila]|uniref:GST N-terminal domain-containing protein n=1 Tax=Athelia psychrophila TaxID=1759441 RepID=A0A166U786_9AGAM|nr:hypothetical protein FIBSPDRAFT_926046 [Fibularhizoctonia sp. CBS 109695]
MTCSPISFNANVDCRSTGENFAPTFLRLNPKGTVPTLVVPLQKTLGPDTESRYRPITDTKAIVEFLDKGRSVMSRTNTTSDAPAPALAPATISFSSTSATIIDDILHSEGGSPNSLLYMNARDDAQLKALAVFLFPFLKSRHEALSGFIAEASNEQSHLSQKTKAFYVEKQTSTQTLLDVFSKADVATAALDATAKAAREDYFATAKTAWEADLKESLTKLNGEIIGPYCLVPAPAGDQISIADLHLAGWLARIVSLSGGSISEDGDTVTAKVEAHIGGGFQFPKEAPATGGAVGARTTPQSKLAAFWDAIKDRPSFQRVYAEREVAQTLLRQCMRLTALWMFVSSICGLRKSRPSADGLVFGNSARPFGPDLAAATESDQCGGSFNVTCIQSFGTPEC